MSKLPLWAPPGLGVESALGPRQPVLRVHGFPAGSPDAQLLVDAHAGQLKNFYLGQSRNHALGIAEYSSKMIERDGVRYRYSNQSGQEIVTMEVHPEKIEQILRPPPENFWDWAVVDLEFDATGTYGYFSAFMVNPFRPQLTPTTITPIKGVAHDQYSWDYGGAFGDPPLMAYPDYGPPASRQRISGANQRASLRLDLRPFRGMPVAVFDIYGHLDPLVGDTVFVPGVQTNYFQRPGTITLERINSMVLPVSDPDPFGPGSDTNNFPADWLDYTYVTKAVPPGNPHPGQVDSYWGLLAGSPQDTLRTYIYSDTESVSGDIYNHRWVRYRYLEPRTFWPAYAYTTYQLPVAQARLATAYARTFKGDAVDTFSEWTGDAYYRQWENSRIYPERWPMPELKPKLSVPAYAFPEDGRATNHFGDTRLAQIIVDLRTGGVSLSPA